MISRNERMMRAMWPIQRKQYLHNRYTRRRRERWIENIFKEIIVENFPNLGKETDTQVMEAQRSPKKRTQEDKPWCIIKMAKIKNTEKMLKAAREGKKIIYKGNPIRLSADFSTETLQARRKWHDIFKVLKQKDLQTRILYPSRLSFKFEARIKQFPDKQKLQEFTTAKPVLNYMLKNFL